MTRRTSFAPPARYADPAEPAAERMRGILGTCASTLMVDRVSMWRFTDDRRAIECVEMYERVVGGLRRHPAPLMIGGDRRVEAVPVDGVMALLRDEFDRTPCTEHALEPGDRLVLYTDGVTDRLSADGAMYELERLMSALALDGSRSPDAIVERIVADLDDFAAGHGPGDDQTLLVVGID